MINDYTSCLSVLTEHPETFRGLHGWSRTLSRLRAVGYLEGDDHRPTLTGKGLKYCSEQGIRTPQEWTVVRETEARRQRAIDILMGRNVHDRV